MNGDNYSEVVVVSNNKIYLLNKNGFILPSWLKNSLEGSIWFAPIIVDFNFDDSLDIIAITQNGETYAFDYSGKEIFHISSTLKETLTNDPVLIGFDTNNWGIAVSNAHNLYIIEFTTKTITLISSKKDDTIIGYLIFKSGLLVIVYPKIFDYFDITHRFTLDSWTASQGNSHNTRATVQHIIYPNFFPWPIGWDTTYAVSAVVVSDINKDGKPEIIEGENGIIKVLSSNGTILWSNYCIASNQYILRIIPRDLDNDSKTEIMFEC